MDFVRKSSLGRLAMRLHGGGVPMVETSPDSEVNKRPGIRWRPAMWILLAGGLAHLAVRLLPIPQVQVRNLVLFSLGGLTLLALLVWWLAGSRASWRMRLGVVAGFAVVCAALSASIRIRGVTGDLVPIPEWRWSEPAIPERVISAAAELDDGGRKDFPQFLGPGRNAVLDDGPVISADWRQNPPQVLWRQPVGQAWSGFAIVGNRALTLEQRGDKEVVLCLDVRTGGLLWEHADTARYESSLGGVGPRSTPTVADGLGFTFGATGVLNCLNLDDGRLLWQRRMEDEAPGCMPEWGYAGSPLLNDGMVMISAGQDGGRSMRAYRADDGVPVWTGGSRAAGYASPMVCTLAGVPQVIGFNLGGITAHNPVDGTVLWEHPWGNRQPVVAQPLPVGPDQIVFSSGYGIGAELLQLGRDEVGALSVKRVWKSIAMKAKMASFVEHEGFLYGLDDGVLACVDLKDGRRKWKSGRYGHGQLLFTGGLLLITEESGDLCLVDPNPDGLSELARFTVFDAKTWNPPALSGDLLLMRTDQEAACLRLPVVVR